MIRMPHSSLYSMTARLLAKNSARLAQAEEQASSGLRINRPSDAPSDLFEVHQLSAQIADQASWTSNADSATGNLNAMDEALGHASDLILRAREIAIAMASETAGTEARSGAAIEVRDLQDALAAAANSTFNDRYLFAGNAWKTKPFDTTGAYSGSIAEPSTQVGDARTVRTGFDGSRVFNGAADIFATLEALALALEADDAAAVGVTLTDLETSSSMLSDVRSEVGAETLAASDAAESMESLGTLFNSRLAELINVDPATAYLKLSELRTAYDATLQVAGSASTRSLLDYLS